jgi:CRP/FNR family transcriptional regulator
MRDHAPTARPAPTLVRLQPSGEEAIVGLRSAGWFLGAAAVVTERPYAVTASTVTPCAIARIRAAPFRQVLKSNGATSWRVHRMHSEEIYAELARAADDRSLSAGERLQRFLKQFLPTLGVTKNSPSVGVQVPLRHWEIAHVIGVTPQYLCQLFQKLELDGVIRREAQAIVFRSDGV